MPKSLSKRDNIVNKKLSGWDKMIEDAKRGIARLKIAMEHAQDMKAAGEPWPGTQSGSQKSRQQHSD